MQRTESRAGWGARIAGVVVIAGAVGAVLTGCGGPAPSAVIQERARQAGAIPDGASVTGGSVSQGQQNGWTTGTGGTMKFGK